MNEKKPSPEATNTTETDVKQDVQKEIGGFEKRLEPTRYGDWEVNGRCSDF